MEKHFQMVHVPLPCQCEFSTRVYIAEATTLQCGPPHMISWEACCPFCHDTCCLEFRQKALENERLQGVWPREKLSYGHFTDTTCSLGKSTNVQQNKAENDG